ncbi:MAG: hypothetical protein JNK12_21290 [Acidimicrobiales bacterium]|nr:hypothetical protein [Acidimicrobiales bacterium]
MGYRGKVIEQERARELRAESWTLQEIADELGVAKGSVSVWVRDVDFTPKPRQPGAHRKPHPWKSRKETEIADLREEGRRRIGVMSEEAFLVAGTALYAGEGGKTDGEVKFANSDPRMLLLFCIWLRRFFEIDESRVHLRNYLHQGLDLGAANAFWSELLDIPVEQFYKPYRAVPDPSIRKAKHIYGCPSVSYCCTRTHRKVMGLVHALLSSEALPGWRSR